MKVRHKARGSLLARDLNSLLEFTSHSNYITIIQALLRPVNFSRLICVNDPEKCLLARVFRILFAFFFRASTDFMFVIFMRSSKTRRGFRGRPRLSNDLPHTLLSTGLKVEFFLIHTLLHVNLGGRRRDATGRLYYPLI